MVNKRVVPDRFFPIFFGVILLIIVVTVITLILIIRIKPKRNTEEQEFTECYEDPKGRDYRGMVNTSANGYDCLNWDELDNRYWISPENFPDAGLGDHNYCRNPDNDLTPWCYVDNIIIGWDFCEVSDPREDCSVTTVAPPHIPTSFLTTTVVPECYEDPKGRDYRGTVSTSANGYDCLNWDELDDRYWVTPENFPDAGLGDHNYCRNPDNDLTTWCYVDNILIGWDFCDVADPREDCGVTTVVPNMNTIIVATTITPECFRDADGGDYRGSVDHTINGYGCQMWTSQSPHVHVYTPSNYPDSGVGNHNFCRNPDERATAWCYTTNPSIPWQHCDIGMAGENCEATTNSAPTSTATVIV